MLALVVQMFVWFAALDLRSDNSSGFLHIGCFYVRPLIARQ